MDHGGAFEVPHVLMHVLLIGATSVHHSCVYVLATAGRTVV